MTGQVLLGDNPLIDVVFFKLIIFLYQLIHTYYQYNLDRVYDNHINNHNSIIHEHLQYRYDMGLFRYDRVVRPYEFIQCGMTKLITQTLIPLAIDRNVVHGNFSHTTGYEVRHHTSQHQR